MEQKEKQEIEKLREFKDAVRTLIRNLGKSNMIHKSEIEELLEELE